MFPKRPISFSSVHVREEEKKIHATFDMIVGCKRLSDSSREILNARLAMCKF